MSNLARGVVVVMGIAFALGAIASFAMSAAVGAKAQSAIHEIEALIFALISVANQVGVLVAVIGYSSHRQLQQQAMPPAAYHQGAQR